MSSLNKILISQPSFHLASILYMYKINNNVNNTTYKARIALNQTTYNVAFSILYPAYFAL